MKLHAIVPKLTLAALLTAGALLTSSPSAAGGYPLLQPPVDCPMNYEPVICSNGFIYGNSCVAAADGATGCVPYADFG